jgi:hypothetical protein
MKQDFDYFRFVLMHEANSTFNVGNQKSPTKKKDNKITVFCITLFYDINLLNLV